MAIHSAAARIRQVEQRQSAALLAGRPLREQLRVDEYVARRAADPAHTFRLRVRNVGGAIEE